MAAPVSSRALAGVAPSDASGWEGREYGRLLWWLCGTLVVIATGTERLPVVFGTGHQAWWDWSFTYVTLRFVLLPLLCVVHLLLVGVFLLVRDLSESAVSAWPASSAAAPAAYLLSQWLYPLPWFV